MGTNKLTKKELIKKLNIFDDEQIIIVMDQNGGWDNIIDIENNERLIVIKFGGGSPFSDER